MKNLFNLPYLTLSLVCITILASCSKKDDEKAEKTKMELISTGSWKIVAHTTNVPYDYNNDGEDESDLFSAYEECEKDDIFTFNTNGITEEITFAH